MRNHKWISLLAVVLSLVSIAFTSLVLARPQTQSSLSGAPGTMTHQGFLVDNSTPVSGTVALKFGIYSASSGGSPLWEETHNSVAVADGYYTVMLGSQTPLTPGLFDSTTRYLQVSVNLGSGYVDLPRQALSSVPYAFQASQADNADAAPWSGLTGVPAGFADGVDNEGGDYEHVIVVSPSGGDYTSVAAALSSISGSSSSNRYLVWVGPGVYTETALSTVPAYVHLKGAGSNATVVTSSRSSGSPGNAAATVDLLEDSAISDMTVHNTGTGTYGIAIYSTQASRDTTITNVVAEANGSGGTGHYAVYLNDAEPTIQDSILRASGATGFGTGVNAAIGIVNISAGFPRPLIKGSLLTGGNNNVNGLSCAGNSGTGFGIQGVNAAPIIMESYICGDRRGIFIGTNGQAQIHNSELWVSSTSGSFMVETTSSGTVILTHSGVFYAGNKYTGTGGLVCTYNHKANYTAATDGTTSGTACN